MKKLDREMIELFSGAPKTATALIVLLHAKQQQRRGRQPSMPFGAYRNPRIAVTMAWNTLHFYTPGEKQGPAEIARCAIALADFMGESVKVRFHGALINVAPRSITAELLHRLSHLAFGKDYDEAVKWLGFARSRLDCHFDYANQVRLEVAKAGCTLADIGTSEDELMTIQRDFFRRSALNWLKIAQSSNDEHSCHIRLVRDEVAKAGCTLADIGTSEAELEIIQKQIYRRSALYWLEIAQRSEHGDAHICDWVSENAGKGGCSLADIGTSEAKLEIIRKEIFKRSALKWLERYRARKADIHSLWNYIKYIRQDAAKAGCTLADIGTSEAELSQIAA